MTNEDLLMLTAFFYFNCLFVKLLLITAFILYLFAKPATIEEELFKFTIIRVIDSYKLLSVSMINNTNPIT